MAILILVGVIAFLWWAILKCSKNEKKIKSLELNGGKGGEQLEMFEKWKKAYLYGWKRLRWICLSGVFLPVGSIPIIGFIPAFLFVFGIAGSIFYFYKSRKYSRALGFSNSDALEGRIRIR